MIPDPLALNYDASNETTFAKVNYGQNSSLYVDVANTDQISQQLRILHATGGRIKSDPTYLVNRHIVTLSRDEYVGAIPRREVATMNVSVALPNTGSISRAEFDKMSYMLRDFFATTDLVDRLLRREI